MGSEWKQAALLDYYDIRSGLSKPAGEFGSGFPFVSFKDVFYNYFLPSELTQLVRSSEKEQESCSVKRGDVFLTRTSETMNELGMSSVALKDYEHATFNGFSKRLRPKLGCPIFPEFIGYYLRSPQFRAEMLSFSTMSTRASLNNEMIGRLNVSIPPMGEQKCIAWVLKTLDDKIQLNRQTNQTLEQMAQALFKSWFVDFDPVIDNALTAGNPIPEELQARAQRRQQQLAKPDHQPLPDDVRQLFPSEFEETEALGWVPKGWKEIAVKDLVTVTDYVANGSFAALKQNVTLYDEQNYALYIRTTDYKNGFSSQKAKYVDKSSYDFLKKSSLNGSEVIISNVGDVGTVFKPPVWLGVPMTLGSNAIAIKGSLFSSYLYQYFQSELGQHQIDGIVGGSAQQKFNKTGFRSLKVLIPSLDEIKLLNQLSESFDHKFNLNAKQTNDLEVLRDTLLPKLISGELRLPESMLDSETNPPAETAYE